MYLCTTGYDCWKMGVCYNLMPWMLQLLLPYFNEYYKIYILEKLFEYMWNKIVQVIHNTVLVIFEFYFI